MKEEKDKITDQFIKDHLETEKPSADFSDKVMQQIVSLEQKKEKALGSLVQKYILESPSVDFSDKVISQILKKEAPVFVYQPVLGKKVWYSLAIIIGLIVVYSFTSLDYQENQIDYIGKITAKIGHNFSFQLPQVIFSPIFALGLFALSFFLGIDFYIQNKINPHKTNSI
ncbi:MAG: hypothetical protein J7K34_04685 [Flavobacteriaceae bacterium]|nr:hypothetical protein [Flavobacteriaceae bacterium]